MDYVLASPIGMLIGVLLGTLGGGGAILAVPALVYLLGQQPRAAAFASLVIVVVSATAGLAAHWRAGRVRVGAGAAFAAAGLVGSFLGSQVSVAVDPNALLLGFAVLMLVIAGIMAHRLRRANGTGPTPGVTGGRTPGVAGGRTTTVAIERTTTSRIHQVAIFAATATGIGFLTGLFGVGGGIIVVPTLVLVLGFDMPVAVGTSLVVIILNSLAAMAARLGTDIPVDWPLIATFTASAVVGALAGNRIASWVDTRRLTQAFVGLIVVVAAYIITGQVVFQLV